MLFAFVEYGYPLLRGIEKLCKTDIRFLCTFINEELNGPLEEILREINSYIFRQEQVDLNHVYIDGTKIEANANKYTWVWKKSCEKSILREFGKLTKAIQEANETLLQY